MSLKSGYNYAVHIELSWLKNLRMLTFKRNDFYELFRLSS